MIFLVLFLDNSQTKSHVGHGFDSDPFLKVESPNGNEQWQKGTVHYINWSSQDIGDSVSLHFSTNGGMSYSIITGSAPNDGVYQWLIPDSISNLSVIKIIPVASSSIFDISDAVFFITEEPERFVVESPNGGEIWEAGSEQLITWHGAFTEGTVDIFYGENGFNPIKWELIADNVPNNGSYQFTVPNLPGRAIIRIQSSDHVLFFDESDQVFDVIAPAQSLTVVQPNGGEVWPAGSEQEIIWTANLLTDTVQIELTIDGGNSYQSITDKTWNSGAYVWTLPNELSDQCLVKISAVNNTVIRDESDAYFSITTSQSRDLTVTNTQDQGPGSLNEAITRANQMPGFNTISFAIPKTDPGYDEGSESFVILLENQLPVVSDDSLLIDGRSQQLFLGLNEELHQPLIDINGAKLGPFTPGLVVHGSEIQIHDLIITGFPGSAISIYAAEHVLISGCYIGVGADGLASEGNGYGIHIYGGGHDNMVLGVDGHPNIISGNLNAGVFIQDTSHNNVIHNNLIGVAKDSLTILGNVVAGIAIQEGSDYNVFIGNVIGGNTKGIQIAGGNNNEVIGNLIGASQAFEYNLGNENEGVLIYGDSKNNLLIDNVMGYNGASGIKILGENALYNRISSNRIALNKGGGISCESGGNRELSAPRITGYENAIISGNAEAGQTIEVFLDSVDQGMFFHGTFETDMSGNFSIPIDEVPPGLLITATATDAEGNTSEFSNPYQISTATQHVTSDQVLFEAYPNPLRYQTSLVYSTRRAGKVQLEVLNSQGMVVSKLLSAWQAPGTYIVHWDRRNLIRREVSPGFYYARLSADDERCILKLVVL